MAKIIKKLSMRHLVGGNVGKFLPIKQVPVEGKPGVVKEVPDLGQTAWIVNVVGIARGIKSGESNYGLWEALMGDFVAVPLVGDAKGQQFRTGQLFLPDVVLNMVSAALGTNTGVEFAFKIGITAVATDGPRPSATGYEYTADFLMEPKANDPLTALISAAMTGIEDKTDDKGSDGDGEKPAADTAKK